jgi:hypothetical protein
MGEVIQFTARRGSTCAATPTRGSAAALAADLLRRLAGGELRCLATRGLPGRGFEVDLELWCGVRLLFTTDAVALTSARVEAALRDAADQLHRQAASGGILRDGVFRQRWLEAAEDLTRGTQELHDVDALAAAVLDSSEALLCLQAAPRIWAAAWDTAEGRQRVGW